MKLPKFVTNLALKVAASSGSYTPDELYMRMERYMFGSVHSGVAVTESTAMRFITVYSCVRVLAETLASLPLFVYRTMPNGGANKATDHPLYDLINFQPNDEMNTSTWREAQMGHLVLSGNCYSVITLNGKGNVVDIYPVPWTACQPFRDYADMKIKYRITDRGQTYIYPAEKVFHVPGLGFDGIMGYSPIRMTAESIGLGIAAEEFAARFYGQGMNVGGVVEVPNEMSDPAYQRFKEDLEERGAGMHNSWKPLILEGGAKFSRIPMPLTDAQFVESRAMNRDDICGLFRVPPHMIANLDRATNNNIEQQSLEFVMYSLLPYITKWENAINAKLLSKKDRQQGYYAKFNVEGLLRGDYLSRQQGLAVQRQNGVINANEWRAMEELNPIDGDAGTAYLVNGAMVATSTAHAATQPLRSGGGGEQSVKSP
ncbi:phage portal protein [Alicyclobacillus fastidiosus]|uniref:Phage portal protein n=1 Tax=Alicyclobacillus fastidiosus TaxID=392011 RepID=A0ABY6ZL25_9BACL|nr:phage portal protein [Alicyclobacillus fastidiosus]WAH42821.1 phage portal protein [Alicyclobacillus fastidiosus]GMA64750.1 portal protein [Alicyclobacillus fastidiosus]